MEKSERAVNPSIRMGEISIAGDGEELRTLLGSCIGLVLYDRRHRVGGLAHIVLPYANGKTERPGKFADTAIPTLIERLQARVGKGLKVSARMAGGASMFSTAATVNIGEQNLESCEKLLRELKIPIVGTHCGGTQGRRMSLDTATGKVVIEIVGQDPIEL